MKRIISTSRTSSNSFTNSLRLQLTIDQVLYDGGQLLVHDPVALRLHVSEDVTEGKAQLRKQVDISKYISGLIPHLLCKFQYFLNSCFICEVLVNICHNIHTDGAGQVVGHLGQGEGGGHEAEDKSEYELHGDVGGL